MPAALNHTQVHVLLNQDKVQAAIATVDLQVDQTVLALVQRTAQPTAQTQQTIASLQGDISADQAGLQGLQQRINVLSQLDSLAADLRKHPNKYVNVHVF